MQTDIQSYMTPLRSILAIALLSVIMLSCGNGEAESGKVANLKAKRDSLKESRSDINAQIAELETAISEADTTGVLRITNVTSLELEPRRFEHFFTIQGSVESDRNAQIFPEVGGKVTSIPVSEGAEVSKGQILMRIDDRVVSNQIEEVKSRLQLAETVYKKQEKLWEKEIGSEIQYLEAKNNYESLKQNLETLESQRALYVIKAPFSGVVDEIFPKMGEMAAPQFPAFRLINIDDMYIKSDVTERYLGQIKAGDSVEVTFPSLGLTRQTVIDRIGSFINPNNRTFKIRLTLENDDKHLKPNLLGELKIRDYVSDSTVVIPSSLVQLTPSGDEFVYVLVENKAQKVIVNTGQTYEGEVEILKGLNPNQVLIDKGARSIKDGDTVRLES